MKISPQSSESKGAVLEQVLREEAVRQSWEAPLETRTPQTSVPLAPSQQQVWFHSQIVSDTVSCNQQITLHHAGPLDRAALERSLDELLRRHQILRTSFASVEGQVVQVVHADLTVHLPLSDLSGTPKAEREAEALRIATAEVRRPFDLGVGPLVRARLVTLAPDDHRVYLTLHQIIFDSLAFDSVVSAELSALYDAFSEGRPSPLAEPEYQYADFALWETEMLGNDVASKHMEYWRRTLAGELPALQLPSDNTRPAAPSFAGATESFAFRPELSQALRNAAETEGVALDTLLMAGFNALLYRYSGQEDLLVGTAADGRKRPEFQDLLGYFLHTVVVRTHPKAALSFRDYLAQVQESLQGAREASDVPFDQLVRELHPKRDVSRHPLFQVMFVVQPHRSAGGSWRMSHMDAGSGFSKFDLEAVVEDRAEGLAGHFTYSTDLFEAGTIRRMIQNWTTLLENAVLMPEAAISALPLLNEAERRLVTETWNATARPVPSATIHGLIESQCARTPDAIAVEDATRSLTYGELNREANMLARRLRELGAGPEVLVGLSVERSCTMLVAVLAVLKSGAAYLPLDPALPEERLGLLLEDAQVHLLLTERALESRLAGPNRLLVFCDQRHHDGSSLEPLQGPRNLAYVLYTSGSTGRPKGVEIEHSAVINFLMSMQREPGFTARDTIVALTTLSFDIAALEIFLPLICGGRVYVVTHEDARDPVRFMEIVDAVSPTVLQGTPGTWRSLIDAGWKGHRKLKVLCGGEAMARDLAQQLLSRCGELWNMYGPTETTIWSTIRRVKRGTGPVPIGRPIDNTQVYVLDRNRQLVPTGVAGELYIGGAGVARGYLRRTELTSERFVTEPSLGPGRLYRTGDLARWLPDGTLECLGRSDHQIKIRGFRIEPEEIEAAILDHPGVTAAAVKAWTDASQYQSLTAYLVGKADASEVRLFLEQKLPHYMVPTRWMPLKALPMTPNGKVDRKQLPVPDAEINQDAYVAPTGEIERRLVSIWESVLGRKNVGIRDSFFDLGGHSLLVSKLLRRLEVNFGVRLSMATVFQAPTIQQLASLLHHQGAEVQCLAAIPLQPKGSKPPLLWLYAGPIYRPLVAHLGTDRPFLGIDADPEDKAAIPEDFTLQQLAARLVQKIRRVQPQGPYHLGGWCAEGLLAYEIAAQLRHEGSDVDVLILLDSVNPERLRNMPRWRVLASRVWFNLSRIASIGRSGVREFWKERVDALQYHFDQYSQSNTTFGSRLSNAENAYDPKPYDGRAVVIMPSQYPGYRNPEEHWNGVLTGELLLKQVTGNHVTMLEEPYVPDLGSCIRQCLEEADAAGERRRAALMPAAKLVAG